MTKTVFVCGDTVQAAMLEDAANALRALGVRVLRGPMNEMPMKHYSDEECLRYLRDADVGVFTIRHEVSRMMLERAPRMRAVCYPTIGVESADIKAANELGVLIAHGATPGNVVGMAEATIMLALALLYNLKDSETRMRSNVPKPPYPLASSLQGKTVGFVGFGRIARAMAVRLAPFGVTLLAASPRTLPEHLPAGVEKVDLDFLMRESDVICVLVSITPESRGMLGLRELSFMKPTAFLINTGRGEAIDETALYRVLKERRIAGAALDTFVVEPLPANSPLRELDNVILTPHMVGQTREARDEFAPAIIDNVQRMLRGEIPRYCKNPEIAERWLASH